MTRKTELKPPEHPPVLIAVDPGTAGAISVYRKGVLLVADLPVTTRTYVESQSKRIDTTALDDLLTQLLPRLKPGTPVVFATEQMQAMRGMTPPSTLNMLSEMAGTLDTVAKMYFRYRDCPLFLRRYRPQNWIDWVFPQRKTRTKASRDAKRDKEESLEFARELFPGLKVFPWGTPALDRKKDHNRCEACLLAFVAMMELNGLVIGSKCVNMKKLREAYHTQSSENYFAELLDVLYAWDPLPPTLQNQLTRRRGSMKIIRGEPTL